MATSASSRQSLSASITAAVPEVIPAPLQDSTTYPLTRHDEQDADFSGHTSASASASPYGATRSLVSPTTWLWFQKYASSAVSSATAEAATFPLDTIKVYRQLKPDAHGSQQLPVSVRTLPLLYSGVSPAVYRSLVYGGITVTLYPPLRRVICGSSHDDEGKHASLWRKCVTGGLAGGTGQLVANPFDLAKSRMQQATRQQIIQQLTTPNSHVLASASSSPSRSPPLTMFSVWNSILSAEGVRGLWRGVVPCVQRAAIVNGSWIAVYDHSKWLVETALQPYADDIPSHYRIVFTYTVASQLAGVVSCAVSGPMDLVKTRLMTQSDVRPATAPTAPITASLKSTAQHPHSNPHSHPHRPYTGTLDCLRRTAAEEGVSALFRGFVPSLVRVGPWSLVFFLVYESMSYHMFGTSQI